MDNPSGLSSSVAGHTTLMGISSKMGGKAPVRIHFLDNSSKMFLIEPTTTVAVFVRIILDKLGVIDSESYVGYFGLFESLNGSAIDGVRDMDEFVIDIIQNWEGYEAAKFVFMVRLFVGSIWGLQYKDVVALGFGKAQEDLSLDTYLKVADMIDPALLNLQYIQAVYHIITGQYPTTAEVALQLGAIHFNLKFGDFDETVHQPGFVGNRIVEFLAMKHLKQRPIEEWETALLGAVRERAKLGSVDLQRHYMSYIFPMSIYGCSFFRCKVSAFTIASSGRTIPENPILGVHQLGIHIFDKQRKPTRSFRIDEIFCWGYRPDENFYFEARFTPDTPGVTIEFDTVEGKKISDLLTDYALAFITEKKRADDRSGSRLPRPPSRRTSKAPAAPTPTTTSSSSASAKLFTSTENEGEGGGEGGDDGRATEQWNSSPVSAVVKRGAQRAAQALPDTPLTLDANPRTHLAATKLQALFRGYRLRKEWSREDAAILIQTVYRGYRARVRVGDMIEALLARGGY